MNRRRAMLDDALLSGESLPDPDPELTAAQLQSWREIVAACPDVLRATDRAIVLAAAGALVIWRRHGELERILGDAAAPRLIGVRETYRVFGVLFMPMRERRRLLFPDRPKRTELS